MSDLKEKLNLILDTNPNWSRQDPDVLDAMNLAYNLSQQEQKQKVEALIEKYEFEANNYFNVAGSQVLRDLKKLIE